MKAVTLAEAQAEAEFGGKAARLAQAVNAGLPVPAGYALDAEMVEAVHRGDRLGADAVAKVLDDLGGPVAVRSSAVGEDTARASFAGQHLTLLNVTTAAEAMAAVKRVRDSGFSESARAYRRRRGLGEAPRMAVVLQRLLAADAAGVLFTQDPVTGRDERVIEASWGLGEAVVGGLVNPDVYRLDRRGRVLETRVGEKHLALRPAPGGGLREETIAERLAGRSCLSAADLALLHGLATRCEEVYGPALDIEWVLAGGRPFLLQSRAITAAAPRAAA